MTAPVHDAQVKHDPRLQRFVVRCPCGFVNDWATGHTRAYEIAEVHNAQNGETR